MISNFKRYRNRVAKKFRYSIFPKITDFLVHCSTILARRKLKKCEPLRILVDSNVIGHAVTHESGWISTSNNEPVEPWGTETGYTTRIRIHDVEDESWIYKNVKFLAGIVFLAKLGKIELVTSAELQAEQIRQPSGRYRGYSIFGYSLFKGLNFKSVDGFEIEDISPSISNITAVERQRRRISCKSDELHKKLVECLGQKSHQDCWHIRTAEVHDCFCFLTMDNKLINRKNNQREGSPLTELCTKILSLEELGEYLNLIPVPPILFNYHDALVRVRPDLSFGSRQRPPSRDRQP